MHERLVTVATYDQPFEADLAVSLLADAGIQAHKAGAYLSGMNSFFSGKSSGIKVQVPTSAEEEARAILESIPDHPPEPDDA